MRGWPLGVQLTVTSSNVTVDRQLLSGMVLRVVLFGLLPALSIAAPSRAQARDASRCFDSYSPPHVELPNGFPFDASRAITLFRFHRQQQALSELDAGRAIVRGPWRWRIPPDLRDEVRTELDALRNCLATTSPPRLATLRVRVLGAEDAPEPLPVAGARVRVDGISVGRTNRDGELTVRVPSGPIEVTAEVPLNMWNSAEVNLTSGKSGSVEIHLSDGKEVDEHTTLVLAEAVDDIVPLGARSLTLRFMQGNRFAPVAHIEQVDAEDLRGDSRVDLAEHFRVVKGEIVAANPARVFEALRPQFGRTIVLKVHAMGSSEDEAHDGTFAFRVGQWSLSVTLAAPPSNPALSVSNIEVGISLMGSGIAVQRLSDATGRFEVASFPEGMVAVECVAVSGGKYYYGDAMLLHSGARSVTLVLRNVEDVKKGVPPLRVNAPTAKDDLLLAHAVDPLPSHEAGVARILAMSAERDRSIPMTTTLMVRRGAERLMLAYEVRTLEQRRDPHFDDVWSLSVFDRDGRHLLHMVRNVRSQDRGHPNWQMDNRTGRIQEIFDIRSHAARGDVSFTLVATSTNAGDDRYPTTVEALITAIDKGWPPTRRESP
jgi:hypothetical protein